MYSQLFRKRPPLVHEKVVSYGKWCIYRALESETPDCCMTRVIIEQIVTMPIYGQEALVICHRFFYSPLDTVNSPSIICAEIVKPSFQRK